jgi:beta-galactosidase GanA
MQRAYKKHCKEESSRMIIYGTQYYRPPFPGSQSWKDDLLKMKACNFNTVKLWAVWSWIERKEGEYYFDDLDTIIDLCEGMGLNVVINTIPEGMPYWLSQRHRDSQYRTSDGYSVEMSGAANMPSGGSPGVCPDKPEVQSRICEFIQRVVQRYAQRQNVIAFDVWNEPHLEPIFDYPGQLFCYCDHSKARFLEWLKAKYSSLATLNRAWLRAYSSWEEVQPPVRHGTYPDMIDWRNFWLENLGVWLDERVQMARRVACGKTIMTHVPFSGYIGGSGEGGLGYHLGDEFILASKVDKFGLTSFPKWLMGNDFVQHLINVELVSSSAKAKDFWQSELQAGAGKWDAIGRSVAKADEIRLWNWSAVAGGAKGVMYWQWKPEPSGMEALGFGLTALDGELSARTEAASACALAFNRIDDFGDSKSIPAVNGILVSRTADLWWHAAYKGESMYAKSLYGAYRACFDAGIPVRMIHADQLLNAIEEGLQVLYVPAAVSLSDRELKDLQEFVTCGGKLVAEACPGLFDEHGIVREDTAFLKEVFGLSGQEVDHRSLVRVQYLLEVDHDTTQIPFSGRYYRQDFNGIQLDTKVICHFEDGRPAVFEHACGQGQAVLVGTFVAAAVALNQDNGSANFITRWMRRTGYNQLVELCNDGNILVRLHQNEDKTYVCVVNYDKSNGMVELVFDRSYQLCESLDQVTLDEGQRRVKVNVSGRDGMLIGLEQLSTDSRLS